MNSELKVEKINNMNNQKLEEIKKLKQEYQDRIREFGQDLFIEAVQPIFDLDERIGAVTWQQYTPYFNDGDACTFDVYDVIPLPADEEVDEEFYEPTSFISEYLLPRKDDENWGDHWNRVKAHPMYEPLAEACDLDIPEDVFEQVFGDHASITITRDGSVSVEECNHE